MYSIESKSHVKMYSIQSKSHVKMYSIESKSHVKMYSTESKSHVKMYSIESKSHVKMYSIESKPHVKMYSIINHINTSKNQLPNKFFCILKETFLHPSRRFFTKNMLNGTQESTMKTATTQPPPNSNISFSSKEFELQIQLPDLVHFSIKVTPTIFYEISKISHICSIFRKSVCIRVVHIF